MRYIQVAHVSQHVARWLIQYTFRIERKRIGGVE